MGIPEGRMTYTGNRVRGRVRVPQNAPWVVREFFHQLNNQEKTLREVSVFSGVHLETLRTISKGRQMPTIAILERALDVLGYELSIREKHYPRVAYQPKDATCSSHQTAAQ